MRRRRNHDFEFKFDDLVDLTPMVNIALILVIVFLCVSPMTLITGIKAVGSKASGVSLGKSSKEDVVKISLAKDKKILINGVEIKRNKLIPHLKDAILKSPKKEVMLMADPENLVEDVVFLLDISKQNGAEKVSIAEK
ncbi:ExbD/TolR family protein [bacterium]